MAFDPTAAITGLGGAAIGAGATWWRVKPEAEGIAVSTLKGVIAELRIELDRKQGEIEVLRGRVNQLDSALDHFAQVADTPPGHLA